MTTMSASEQLWLEMTNRARLDPSAEAARLGISLNEFLPAGASGSPITGGSRQVLAGNDTLARVAETHAATVFNKMVANGALNFNGHDGAGDGTPQTRIRDGGYSQDAAINLRPENFGWANTSAALTQDQLQAMVASNHDGLFIDDPKNTFGAPAGHRLAMLDANAKEAGVGMATGSFQGLNHLMTIENFGTSGARSFLTGAVYDDTVKRDDFYSIGEGISGVKATVTKTSGALVGTDVTGAGGGWSVSEPGGTFKVTFTGAALDRSVSVTVAAGNKNAKVDLVNGDEIDASASTVLGSGARDLRLLGTTDIDGKGNSSGNTIIGNKGDNDLTGGGGRDVLTGGKGDDTFIFTKLSDSKSLIANSDRITDFSHATQNDEIDLHLIDANTGRSGNQSFHFIGKNDYSDRAGELQYEISGSSTRIRADVDGDGRSDFSITLAGRHTLHADDFIL